MIVVFVIKITENLYFVFFSFIIVHLFIYMQDFIYINLNISVCLFLSSIFKSFHSPNSPFPFNFDISIKTNSVGQNWGGCK